MTFFIESIEVALSVDKCSHYLSTVSYVPDTLCPSGIFCGALLNSGVPLLSDISQNVSANCVIDVLAQRATFLKKSSIVESLRVISETTDVASVISGIARR